MNAPELIEELEEFFQSAHDHILTTLDNKQAFSMKKMKNTKISIQEEDKEMAMDPPTRDVLPFFKDSKVKISLWTILKDSIGKDLSKITVPVYFNEPLSILQRCASPLEYIDLLD
jgi:oxysterol-binding protein 1